MRLSRCLQKNPYRYWIAALIVILIGVFGVVLWRPLSTLMADKRQAVIVLSPHFDDAVLSLGGLIAQRGGETTVATFFTRAPAQPTTTPWDVRSGFIDSSQAVTSRTKENDAAIGSLGATVENFGYEEEQYSPRSAETNNQTKQAMARDIQALIERIARGASSVAVYGPSIFTENITHPDHKLLHDAFTDVARSYPNKNVDFYYYEDYPYTQNFVRESSISLKQNVENDTGFQLSEVDIPLRPDDLTKKIDALKHYSSQLEAYVHQEPAFNIVNADQGYTRTRCGQQTACEVVYKVAR
jgi:LmbE family N-acetylglucosaminyl deacetylase